MNFADILKKLTPERPMENYIPSIFKEDAPALVGGVTGGAAGGLAGKLLGDKFDIPQYYTQPLGVALGTLLGTGAGKVINKYSALNANAELLKEILDGYNN